MRLTEKEYNKYLSIHPRLIYYVGKKLNEIPKRVNYEEFMNYSVEEKYPIRNALYENIELVENYIKDNISDLSDFDKEIIRGFKYFKKGTFYVVKLSKKYAFFLSDKYVYGVYALNDPFQMFWGNNLPVMIEAILLPFNGKIIYDGMIQTYPVHLGRGISSSIKNNYRLSEGKYGVITELPEKIEIESAISIEKELLVMMKTKSLREQNWNEIEIILDENPDLMPIYVKEWGKINTRKKKKELKNIGIKKCHFGIYNDTIIASGKSKLEVEKLVADLISDEEIRKSVFYFKL